MTALPSTLPPMKNGCSNGRKGEDKTREDKTMNTNTNRTEQWKTIKGYDGYEVSNKGRVRKLNWNKTGQARLLALNPNPHTKYLQVGLYNPSKQKCDTKYVHRLVAEAFVPNPDNMEFVDHIDGNRQRNCRSNLRWCSRKFNNSRPRTRRLKS